MQHVSGHECRCPSRVNAAPRPATGTLKVVRGGGRTHLVSPAMAVAAAIEGHFVDIRQWS